MLGLKPREFERLQPHEVVSMCEAYKIKTDKENHLRAYFTWWSVLPHTKRGFKMSAIYDPIKIKKEKDSDIIKLRDEKAYFAKMAKEVESIG